MRTTALLTMVFLPILYLACGAEEGEEEEPQISTGFHIRLEYIRPRELTFTVENRKREEDTLIVFSKGTVVVSRGKNAYFKSVSIGNETSVGKDKVRYTFLPGEEQVMKIALNRPLPLEKGGTISFIISAAIDVVLGWDNNVTKQFENISLPNAPGPPVVHAGDNTSDFLIVLSSSLLILGGIWVFGHYERRKKEEWEVQLMAFKQSKTSPTAQNDSVSQPAQTKEFRPPTEAETSHSRTPSEEHVETVRQNLTNAVTASENWRKSRRFQRELNQRTANIDAVTGFEQAGTKSAKSLEEFEDQIEFRSQRKRLARMQIHTQLLEEEKKQAAIARDIRDFKGQPELTDPHQAEVQEALLEMEDHARSVEQNADATQEIKKRAALLEERCHTKWLQEYEPERVALMMAELHEGLLSIIHSR